MSEEGKPPDLSEALANFKTSMAKLGQVATAQGAFGWMVRGDLVNARETLRRLSPDMLLDVSAAASALSALAAEVAAEQGGAQP